MSPVVSLGFEGRLCSESWCGRAASEDFGSATELLNRVWPHRVGSERGLRHAADAEPPNAHRRYWAAEDAGKLVGWATAAIEYQSAERPGFLQVSVAPESRKAGLGTALLERCEAHLAGLGVATVLSFTTPEEASRSVRHRTWFSSHQHDSDLRRRPAHDRAPERPARRRSAPTR